MANLTRYKQKIFANNSDQVGVFGTGTDKVASKNVETLQSADYEDGWSSAIITSKNYPVWQERDGVDYGFSYQLAYLLQKGIPDWLSTETYYQNDYCKVGNVIYYSLQDNNIGHNPSSTTYWTRPFDGQWVTSSLTIATSVNSPTSTNIEYSLSTYLPNDGYTYEVIFSMQGGTAASANSYQYGFLQTDIINAGTVRLYVARVAQGSSNSVKGAGTATLPVGPGRKVIVLADGTNTGTFNLYAEGYRRVGTNS